MRKNRVLEKLHADQPTFGVWMTTGSLILTEIAAKMGFDWILLDTQHGYWGYDATVTALQIMEGTSTVPMARVARNDPALIGRLLDAAVMGLVVPLVNSAEDARRAVAAVRYPPQGNRSAGGSRLAFYGTDYYQQANREIALIVMIETREAVARAEAILSTPGIDSGFIGPTDLALSLGTYGQPSRLHEEAIQQVLKAAKNCGKPLGIHCSTVTEALRRAEQGFRYMPCAVDSGLFSSGLQQAFAQLHPAPCGPEPAEEVV